MKEILSKWFDSIPWERLLSSSVRIVVILAVAMLLYKIIKRALLRIERRLLAADAETPDGSPSENDKRVQTLIRLTRQVLSVVVWVLVGLMVLTELGLDIAPILAGAGIVGLAVGFGAQNLVRDFISGFFMILENQVRVGDVAVINGTPGVVEQINMRTIVLRDVSDVVHIFPNGTITTLSNQTKQVSAYVFDVGVAYREDTEHVSAVISDVLRGLKDDPEYGPKIVGEPEVFGVSRFGESSVEIKGRIRTLPGSQWMVGREFLRRVKHAFDEKGIEIPFPYRKLVMDQPVPDHTMDKTMRN
ncbi:MAG TPA: mechanosensitive ion channel family protein [Myxococcota bacterium]|nr:mechanosensitive ion channel family protein [Myxococcota bacterium]